MLIGGTMSKAISRVIPRAAVQLCTQLSLEQWPEVRPYTRAQSPQALVVEVRSTKAGR